ncbi:MAG TPA: hypothetical protein VFS05_05820, partial [Gemmatimonadaceae bacterium]|nr:hypothetical protein [Gemmatimonadaceae bacterium]
MTRVLLGASRAARWCAAAAWCIVAFIVVSPAIRRAVLGGAPERRAAALTFVATLAAVALGSRRLDRDSLRRVLPDVLVIAGPLVLLLALLAGGLGSSGIVVAALWLVGAGALVSGWRALAAAALVLGTVAAAERQARGEVALSDIMFAAPLLAAAALAPGFLRGTPQPSARSNRAPAGERRRALMLTGDQKAVGGTPAPEPGTSAAPAAELERDVTTLEEYLEDVRLSLGAEEAVAWRWSESSGEMRVVAWASADGGELRFPAAEGAPLVEWASREGFVVTDDAAQPRIVAAPIARGDRLYGALGLYAANGLACGRAEAKSASGRFAAHVGALLELFETRRRAVTAGARSQALLRAAETLQRSLDPEALSEAICSSALAVTGASRATFVSWDAGVDTGRVERSTDASWTAAGTAVAAGSLVALVCRERRRLVMERIEAGPAPGISVFGAGRQHRSPGSLAVVPVMVGDTPAGAIVVEGDEPGQVRAP